MQPLLTMVLKSGSTANNIWVAHESLFRDNKDARSIKLENELHNMTLRDRSINEYCQRITSTLTSAFFVTYGMHYIMFFTFIPHPPMVCSHIQMLTREDALSPVDPRQVIAYIWVIILYHGHLNARQQFLDLVSKPSTIELLMILLRHVGS